MTGRAVASLTCLALLVPSGAAAQEPEWVLDLADPVGDVSDNADQMDYASTPAPPPDYIDLTHLRVESEGDHLVVTFEVDGNLPTTEAPMLYEFVFTIDWDRHKGFYAKVFPDGGYVEYVDLSRFNWEPKPRPVEVEGKQVRLRVPTKPLGPLDDLKFGMWSEAHGTPDLSLLGFNKDGNPPEDLEATLEELGDEIWDLMAGTPSYTDFVPDDVEDRLDAAADVVIDLDDYFPKVGDDAD